MSKRKLINIRLNEEHIAKLDRLADGYGRAAVVARLIDVEYENSTHVKKDKSLTDHHKRLSKIGTPEMKGQEI